MFVVPRRQKDSEAVIEVRGMVRGLFRAEEGMTNGE
jgi:hypothetical protein